VIRVTLYVAIMVTPPLLDLSPKRVDGLKLVVVFWPRRKVVLAMVPVREVHAAAIVVNDASGWNGA
nr:hypothetical protein [Tanacetum cinerariifolium]